jgi:hypothetical protein
VQQPDGSTVLVLLAPPSPPQGQGGSPLDTPECCQSSYQVQVASGFSVVIQRLMPCWASRLCIAAVVAAFSKGQLGLLASKLTPTCNGPSAGR